MKAQPKPTMSSTTATQDADSVLSVITRNLTKVKSRAAVGHYDSRRIWVARLNESLNQSVEALSHLEKRVAKLLMSKRNLSSAALTSKSLMEFRKIVPAILRNQVSVVSRLAYGTRAEPIYTLKGKTNPSKTFDDFSELATITRQYVDSTIQDAYQLVMLDSKEFNFHVLNSLHSFVHLAPRGLQIPFTSKELVDIVEWFDQLSWKQRKKSSATSCQKERFGEKVDFLVTTLKPQFDLGVDTAAKATFRFCSEFTHVGYVSTLVTSADLGEFYMASADGVFFASTENYVELNYRLLKGAYLIFADIYLRAVGYATSIMLSDKAYAKVAGLIEKDIARSRKVIKSTGFQLTQFIAREYVRRPKTLRAKCICGEYREWNATDDWFNFCRNCGTKYGVIEWPQDIGYVITPQGPCDVVGSIHPPIDDLTEAERARIYALWDEFKKNRRAGKIDGKYLIPALAVRNLKTFTVPQYDPLNQELITFISGKKLSENDGIPIFCNCGCVAILKKGFEGERWRCFGCGSTIKMLALDGDSGYVFGSNPDGSPRLIPVQGNYRELTPEEKKKALESAAKVIKTSSRPAGRIRSGDVLPGDSLL